MFGNSEVIPVILTFRLARDPALGTLEKFRFASITVGQLPAGTFAIYGPQLLLVTLSEFWKTTPLAGISNVGGVYVEHVVNAAGEFTATVGSSGRCSCPDSGFGLIGRLRIWRQLDSTTSGALDSEYQQLNNAL